MSQSRGRRGIRLSAPASLFALVAALIINGAVATGASGEVTPVPAGDCSADPGATTFFCDDFSASTVTSPGVQWSGSANDGALDTDGSSVNLSSPPGSGTFPYFYPTNTPIPTAGDFTVTVRQKFGSSETQGTDFALVSQLPSDSSESAADAVIVGALHDDSNLVQFSAGAACTADVPDPTSFHVYRWSYVGPQVTLSIDGTSVASCAYTSRPTQLFLGNSVATGGGNWTQVAFDYVRVEAQPSSSLSVPTTADVFAAAAPSVPALPGGGGTLPPGVPVVPGAHLQISASGSGGCGAAGGDAGPDGSSGGPEAQIQNYYGISGYNAAGGRTCSIALSGVFTGSTQPLGPGAPPRLDFTTGAGQGFASLAPAIAQSFFIGDGLTGTGSGSSQIFVVPAGATTLWLGVLDGQTVTSGPGYYDDNDGSYSVTVTNPGGGATPVITAPSTVDPDTASSFQVSATDPDLTPLYLSWGALPNSPTSVNCGTQPTSVAARVAITCTVKAVAGVGDPAQITFTATTTSGVSSTATVTVGVSQQVQSVVPDQFVYRNGFFDLLYKPNGQLAKASAKSQLISHHYDVYAPTATQNTPALIDFATVLDTDSNLSLNTILSATLTLPNGKTKSITSPKSVGSCTRSASSFRLGSFPLTKPGSYGLDVTIDKACANGVTGGPIWVQSSVPIVDRGTSTNSVGPYREPSIVTSPIVTDFPGPACGSAGIGSVVWRYLGPSLVANGKKIEATAAVATYNAFCSARSFATVSIQEKKNGGWSTIAGPTAATYLDPNALTLLPSAVAARPNGQHTYRVEVDFAYPSIELDLTDVDLTKGPMVALVGTLVSAVRPQYKYLPAGFSDPVTY